jgi:hypothetical protein
LCYTSTSGGGEGISRRKIFLISDLMSNNNFEYPENGTLCKIEITPKPQNPFILKILDEL